MNWRPTPSNTAPCRTVSGRIALSWEALDESDGPQLEFVWRESGGPVVIAPTKEGFGVTLIKREIEYNLGGSALVEFSPEGVTARLRVPLKRVRGVEQ